MFCDLQIYTTVHLTWECYCCTIVWEQNEKFCLQCTALYDIDIIKVSLLDLTNCVGFGPLVRTYNRTENLCPPEKDWIVFPFEVSICYLCMCSMGGGDEWMSYTTSFWCRTKGHFLSMTMPEVHWGQWEVDWRVSPSLSVNTVYRFLFSRPLLLTSIITYWYRYCQEHVTLVLYEP